MNKYPGIYEVNTKGGVRYQLRYRLNSGVQKSKTFRTATDAKRFKANVEAQKSTGNFTDLSRSKVTFAEVVADWLSLKTSQADSTRESRDSILRTHLIPKFGNQRIIDIRHADIQRAVNRWTEHSGLSSYSVRNNVTYLNQIFKFAIRQELLVRNPVTGVELPRLGTNKRRPLQPHECAALLEAVDSFYRPLVAFTLATGLRWSEVREAKLTDVDFKAPLLKVGKSKTDAGIREISLSANEIELIQEHLKATHREGSDLGPLFVSPNGKLVHYSNFTRRVFTPAVKAAGLDGVTFHDLRRTHATMLVHFGADAKVVQERMGHKSISTTLSYYAVATEAAKSKASNAMSSYLKGSALRAVE
jgi:integrase